MFLIYTVTHFNVSMLQNQYPAIQYNAIVSICTMPYILWHGVQYENTHTYIYTHMVDYAASYDI